MAEDSPLKLNFRIHARTPSGLPRILSCPVQKDVPYNKIMEAAEEGLPSAGVRVITYDKTHYISLSYEHQS